MASLIASLSSPEVRLLQAYAEGDANAVATCGVSALVLDQLRERGYVQSVDRGVLVTPEGLAALLDVVPVDIMRMASPVEELAAASPDAPNAPSRDQRRLAAPSSRRRPKRN